MSRNQFRNQLFSSLNPDSMYQVLTNRQQKVHTNQPNEKRQLKEIKIKTESNSVDKQKYLTIVSKPKKMQKRSRSTKKTLVKKCQSVILGGTKKANDSFMNGSEQSMQNSHCNSCTNLFEQSKKITLPTQIPSQPIMKPLITPLTQRNSPINFITAQNDNSQLTRIINHKLNLAAVQPHQLFCQKMKFSQQKNRNAYGERKLLRNMSSSNGRIYFSVGSEGDRKQVMLERVERPFLTPRFDKTEDNKQKRTRKNAGFIRSASAKKHSPQQKNINHQQRSTISNFSPTTLQQPFSTKISKSKQIDQCIQKMSLIRKQIDQLQQMIHDRLQTSQLRNKLMYTNNNSQSMSRVTMRRDSFGGSRQSSMSFSKGEMEIKNSPVVFQQRKKTLVDDLNGLSRASLSGSLSNGKVALVESNFLAQQQNVTQSKHQLNFLQQKSTFIPMSQPSFNLHTNNPTQSFTEIYKLKCPTLIPSQQMQKQLINQFSERNSNNQPLGNRDKRWNQENIEYSFRNHQQQQHQVSRIR